MVLFETLRQKVRGAALALLLPCLGGSLLLNSSPATAGTSASSRVVKLAADPWCPYNCAPNSAHPGYMIELARTILVKSGYSVEYRTRPWSRALVEAHNGVIDGAVGATYEDGRGLVFGHEALGIDHTVVAFAENSTVIYSGPHSLDGLKIGIIDNYGYNNGGPIDQYLADRRRNNPDSVVVLATDHALRQLIEMLRLHYIDAIFASGNVLNYTLKLMHLQGQLKISDTAAYNVVNIAFTPDARGRKLARLMDQGLRKLRQTGRLAKILAEYGLTDWVAMMPLTSPHPAEIRHRFETPDRSESLVTLLSF
ncbi:substrate-binding periplasmic protein [Mangrovitalea sediminis]|uniref:substrate-binding periplasmic protein n=1 Tax=Mangrovitalea sediminis TaxID=1982043 RepID=UPI000BE57683|nr:transporter substrate-binding domain-containing protein [Mangrovitalea sediminis]